MGERGRGSPTHRRAVEFPHTGRHSGHGVDPERGGGPYPHGVALPGEGVGVGVDRPSPHGVALPGGVGVGGGASLPLWVCQLDALVSISVPPSQSYISSSPSSSVAWGFWVLGEGMGDGHAVGNGV